MLTQFDKENILSDFPNIKLSYENIIYKKVSNFDYIEAIPLGKKYFAWFTIFNEKNTCLIMELMDNKQIVDIKIVNSCFSNELSYGTIFYGTMLTKHNNFFFYIEDIFNYKGEIFNKLSWGDKLVKINNILKNDLKQIAYNNNFVIFGLPLISSNLQDFESKIKNLNYNIDSVQFKLFSKINNYLVINYKNYISNYISNNNSKNEVYRNNEKVYNNIENMNLKKNCSRKKIIFNVRPDFESDIYLLFCLNDDLIEIHHCYAHIPDFNTSVMMNKLFRIIKENDNLDKLEESDNEEEFENENINKFVHLDKSLKMYCNYNNKFKKWIPVNIVEDKDEIVNLNQLKDIYKNYEQKNYNVKVKNNNY
jgi:hypothetical protein